MPVGRKRNKRHLSGVRYKILLAAPENNGVQLLLRIWLSKAKEGEVKWMTQRIHFSSISEK